MNFQPLYTASRVIGSILKIATSVMMLMYLVQRNQDRKRIRRRIDL